MALMREPRCGHCKYQRAAGLLNCKPAARLCSTGFAVDRCSLAVKFHQLSRLHHLHVEGDLSRVFTVANAKNRLAVEVLKEWDEHGITRYVLDNYLQYHTEAIENAYADIDGMLKTGKPAW